MPHKSGRNKIGIRALVSLILLVQDQVSSKVMLIRTLIFVSYLQDSMGYFFEFFTSFTHILIRISVGL